jgi:hypothetical protein
MAQVASDVAISKHRALLLTQTRQAGLDKKMAIAKRNNLLLRGLVYDLGLKE